MVAVKFSCNCLFYWKLAYYVGFFAAYFFLKGW